MRHFLGRGFIGKAMVVSIDKATALKMYDKVRKHWAEEAARVQKELARPDLGESDKQPLRQRLEVLQTTDMALIVSPGQNEIAQMQSRPRHRAAPQADERIEELGREVQRPERPAAAGVPLRHVADGLRRAELFHRLSRQADAQSHPDADHRPREPRFPRQAQRRDRGLRERLCLAGKGAGHLWRRQGR